MARSYTAAERDAADAARRETVEQLHQQLADRIGSLDGREAWEQWLTLARSLHSYSFNNSLLILIQNPNASMVAGYRTWQANGHQVRKGEKAIKILGPVTKRVDRVDPSTGAPIIGADGKPEHRYQIVGVRPVSVFDSSQVDPPPVSPPEPVLLTGEAPPGLWDSLAELVAQEGFTLARGDCHGANGYTDFAAREVRVRDDIDDAAAVKTLAHELGHVLTIDPSQWDTFVGRECRGLREVEAESVAYMVTQAHGLDSAQYTFNYVAGWASQAVDKDTTIDDVVAKTGQKVIAAVDRILRHTQPSGTEPTDALARELGITETDATIHTPSGPGVRLAAQAQSVRDRAADFRQEPLPAAPVAAPTRAL